MSSATATLLPKKGTTPRIGTKYQIYKAATTSLAQWLAKQAQKLGVAFDRSHQQGTHAVKIEQFLLFTDRIVKADPTIVVPYEVITLAKRAVSVRKECAEILRGKDTASDMRHEYFINVIDQVYERLLAHYQAWKKGEKQPAKDKNGLVAKFEHLQVEEVEGETDEEASEGEEDKAAALSQVDLKLAKMKKKKRLAKKKSKAKKAAAKMGKDIETAVEIESAAESSDFDPSFTFEEEEDPYFVLMCLLSDLASMRAFVKEMWADYACNKIDLITVSLTTNATFDIIRTYEQDFPAIKPLVKDYSKTLKLILGRRLDENDEGLNYFFNANNTPDQFDTMCSSLCWIEDTVELACGNAFYFLNGPRHQMVWKKPDGTMGINLKRDPFGKYDPAFDRREVTYDDRLEHDIRILASFAADVYVNKNRESVTADHFTMQWDAFALTGDKTVTLSEAFGAQLYLDMYHLSGANLSDAFKSLQGAAARVIVGVDAWFKEEPKDFHSRDIRAAFAAEISGSILVTQRGIAQRSIADKVLFEESKNELYKKEGKGDRFDSKFDLSFMEKNPLLCGISQFSLTHAVRDCGLTLGYAFKSIISAGQLYYTCRMHRDNKPGVGSAGRLMEEGVHPCWKKVAWKWDDMDYLFQMMGEKTFFEGHIPTTNHEILKYNGVVKSYNKAKGLTRPEDEREEENLYRPSMAPPKAGDKIPSRLDTTHELVSYEGVNISHRLFHAKYGTYHPSAEHLAVTSSWTEGTLLALLGKEALGEVQEGASAEDRVMSHLALLKALKQSLRTESRALRFDTLSFHIRCFKLLRSLKSKILSRIDYLAPYSKKMLLDDDVDNMGLGQKLALAAFIKEVKFMGMWRIGSEAPKESVPLFTSRMIVAIDHNIRDYLAENRCKDAEIQIINSQWSFSKSNPDLQSAMRYRSMLMNMRDYMPPHITEGEKRAMLRQVGVKI